MWCYVGYVLEIPKGILQYLVIRANTIKGFTEDEIFCTPLIKNLLDTTEWDLTCFFFY